MYRVIFSYPFRYESFTVLTPSELIFDHLSNKLTLLKSMCSNMTANTKRHGHKETTTMQPVLDCTSIIIIFFFLQIMLELS